MSVSHHISIEEIAPILEAKEPILRKYCSLLAGYSGRIRLTGPSDPEVLWNEHILDSCYALPLLPPAGRVLDLGTGGGLPGIVWALCRPDLEICLLDSIKKKCTALKQIVSELSISNVKIICARSEELASGKERESFDMVGARAVTNAGVLSEYFAPLVKTNGTALAFKGPGYLTEVDGLDGRWETLGFSEPIVKDYSIGPSRRFFIIWNKVGACASVFPRRPGMAEKKPWWRCKFDHSCND